MTSPAQQDANAETNVRTGWSYVQQLTAQFGPEWAQNIDAISNAILEIAQ